MKTVGILAHVDAGKTTLSEAVLYRTGARHALGRVDQKNAFLDSDPMERRRGITIFSGEAPFSWDGEEFTLVDTPGHGDFAPETERALAALDAAVLVVSAPEGVRSHTRTLLRLALSRSLPVFVFLNKCDCVGAEPERALSELSAACGIPCADLTDGLTEQAKEQLAVSDDALLEAYLNGTAEDGDFLTAASRLASAGKLLPAVRGSALHGEGVERLLWCLRHLLSAERDENAPLSAVVWKLRHDQTGARVTHLKILSGTLLPRQQIGEEKAAELRRYSGEKYVPVKQARAGELCAVTGLSALKAGDRIGDASVLPAPCFVPLLRTKVTADASVSPQRLLEIFRTLEAEEPTLSVAWNGEKREVQLALMGEIQTELLRELTERRFGLHAEFSPPEILYRETIAAPVCGCGHYEPLRHYAEVHLRLSPGRPGSGVTFDSECPTDDLAVSWQRLIETHVLEKQHTGVLTGSPLTDVRVTLLAGRAHVKHTEGGDFRQAVYRAIRQALMHAENVLLEPWERFRFEVPVSLTGRILTDLRTMSARTDAPETVGERSVITGTAPASELLGYRNGFASLTRGAGMLELVFDGYEPCHDTENAVSRLGYDAERDTANSAASVFCDHGVGVFVPWNEAPGKMHIHVKGEEL